MNNYYKKYGYYSLRPKQHGGQFVRFNPVRVTGTSCCNLMSEWITHNQEVVSSNFDTVY
jgi:hypothetical protein